MDHGSSHETWLLNILSMALHRLRNEEQIRLGQRLVELSFADKALRTCVGVGLVNGFSAYLQCTLISGSTHF